MTASIYSKVMYLHEEVLLLVLKDDTGKIDWKAGFYSIVMGGALVAELILEERLKVSEDKKHLVSVANASRHENDLLQEALETIGKTKRPRNIQHWVTKLSSIKGLKTRTARNLCRQGILKEEQGKILFIFNSTKYPELNPEPEREIIARLEQAIFSDEAGVDIRTALLISLTHPSGILQIPFSRKELRKRKQRIKQITSGELIGQATGAAIQAVQAAMTVIAVMPAITAGSSHGGTAGC